MEAIYFNKKNFIGVWKKMLFKGDARRSISKMLAVVILLSFILPSFISAQVNYPLGQKWKWLHPKPIGTNLRWCKMWDSNTWYLAGSLGVFMKTFDAGATWNITYTEGINESGLKADINDAHFFNQNTGICVGANGNVYKTTDGGATFESIPGMSGNYSWWHIYFLNNNTGYIAGFSGKVAKTSNGGNSWSFYNTIPVANYTDVWSPNDTLIFVCSTLGNIHKSTNMGTSWSTISTGPQAALRRLYFLNKDTGFVCGLGGIVRLTTNSGENWVDVNAGLPNSAYYDIDHRTNGPNNEVYLTGNPNYIYKTTNFGSLWDTVGFNVPGQEYMGNHHWYWSTFLGGGDSLLTVGSSSLINKRNSPSNRISYTQYTKLGYGEIYDLAVNNNKIWAVGSPTSNVLRNDQIIFSANGGNTWTVQNANLNNQALTSICMLDDNTGYVAGSKGNIRKTINGGATWDNIVYPDTNNINKIQFINPNTGWVFGTQGTILKTTDGGASWSQQYAEGVTSQILSAQMLDENTGWIVGDYAKVSKTTNGGVNWFEQNPHTSSGSIPLFEIKMLDMNTGYIAGNSNFCKTTDGGNDWVRLNMPMGQGFQLTGMDFINSEIGMAIYDFGSWKTSNGGTSWVLDVLGASSSYNFFYYPKLKMISADTAYLGSNQAGVLKYTSGVIGIIEWESGVPDKYELYQNYPNPFNPSTTIKFAIPKTGRVSLKVYDITGREVMVILDNLQLSAGTVKHTFNGSELASGVYFYSLYIENEIISTKKMVLVK